MKVRRLRVANRPKTGLARRTGDDRTTRLLRLDDRFRRSRTPGKPETVGLADDGIARHSATQLFGDLACRKTLQPEALQKLNAFLCPSHDTTYCWHPHMLGTPIMDPQYLAVQVSHRFFFVLRQYTPQALDDLGRRRIFPVITER